MKKLFGKINFNRNYFLLGLFILVVVAIVLPQTANAADAFATVGNTVVNIGKLVVASPILIALGTIAVLAMGLFGALDMMIIGFLVNIVQYNNFINEPSIRDAWIIVRDLCNMFFILILLVIAFATILRLPSYEWKKLLPKLLIMAVLINFSRTICGLIIDASQVVMLTFTNTFGAGGNFVDMTQMGKYFSGVVIDKITTSDWSVLNVVIGLLIGIMFLIISGIVLTVAMSVFLMRIVMLWIYIVLSPLAFLAAAFPAGQKYASQWWSEFMKYILNGPVLAFFIWMALITSQQKVDFFTNDAAVKQCFGTSQIMCMGTFMPFILSIGMLIGGLIITQQIGGVGSGIASKGLDFAKKAGTKILNGDNFVARKVSRAMGVDWRPIKLAESFKASMETGKRKDESEIRRKSKEHFESTGLLGGVRSVALGMGAGESYFNRYVEGFLGYKGVARAVKGMAYDPFKRRSLGGKIDTNIAETEELKKERGQIAGSYEKKITRWTGESLKRNVEYKKFASNKVDVDRIDELMKKPNTTEAEEKELDRLQKKETDRKARRAEIEKSTRNMVEKKTLESDGDYVKKGREIDAKEEEARKLKGEMMNVQQPMAFEGRSQYRRDIEEAKSKYKSITNADELLKAFTDASQRRDKFDQIAILEKLSGDANLNEELRAKGYSSDSKGLHRYVFNKENDFGEKKGLQGSFSEIERLQVQNDLGELEERVGHWETAKMCGMNEKGEMVSLVKEKQDENGKTYYDNSEHTKAAYAEMIKFDPQKIINSMNRLALGGEDGSGKFQVADLGKMIFRYLASSGAYEKNEGRILGNTAANLTLPHVKKALKQALSDMPEEVFNANIKILEKKGAKGGNLADDMLRQIKIAESINKQT